MLYIQPSLNYPKSYTFAWPMHSVDAAKENRLDSEEDLENPIHHASNSTSSFAHPLVTFITFRAGSSPSLSETEAPPRRPPSPLLLRPRPPRHYHPCHPPFPSPDSPRTHAKSCSIYLSISPHHPKSPRRHPHDIGKMSWPYCTDGRRSSDTESSNDDKESAS